MLPKPPAFAANHASATLRCGVSHSVSSCGAMAASASHLSAALWPMRGTASTHGGGGGTRSVGSARAISPIRPDCSRMVDIARKSGTIRTSSSATVITATAAPRRPPRRAWRPSMRGQVETTIIVAQSSDPRNGSSTQRLPTMSRQMPMTDRVMRVRSRYGAGAVMAMPAIVPTANRRAAVHTRRGSDPAEQDRARTRFAVRIRPLSHAPLDSNHEPACLPVARRVPRGCSGRASYRANAPGGQAGWVQCPFTSRTSSVRSWHAAPLEDGACASRKRVTRARAWSRCVKMATWSPPSMASSSAPGFRAAIAFPCSNGATRSRVPCTTSTARRSARGRAEGPGASWRRRC